MNHPIHTMRTSKVIPPSAARIHSLRVRLGRLFVPPVPDSRCPKLEGFSRAWDWPFGRRGMVFVVADGSLKPVTAECRFFGVNTHPGRGLSLESDLAAEKFIRPYRAP